MRAIMETAVDAIITINDAGIIETVNRRRAHFGFESADLIGQNVSTLMAEPDRTQHDEYLARYLQTRKASVIGVGRRVTGRRKDGSEFPIHLAVSEYSVDGNRFFTGIVRDLTELEQVQQQLLQSERLVALARWSRGLPTKAAMRCKSSGLPRDMLSLDLAGPAGTIGPGTPSKDSSAGSAQALRRGSQLCRADSPRNA